MGSGTYCKVDTVVPQHHYHQHNASSNIHQYAYKSIDPRRVRSPEDFNIATTELANEAKMLSALDHENIIKLRGVSSERFSESFSSGSGDGYFLMMDVLNETLKERLEGWRKERKQLRRRTGLFQQTQKVIAKKFQKKKKVAAAASPSDCKNLHRRVHETVLGIAKGMRYLHSKKIVLRDMKPANIGYENNHYEDEMHGVESTVKLFDFGMAQSLEDCDADEIAGSPRYMAPEVMAHEGYTLAVDVYSFGVLLYEVCSLKSPFEESYRKRKNSNNSNKRSGSSSSSSQSFCEAVVEDQLKPYHDLEREVSCPMLRSMIEACCDHDPSQRPSFEIILEDLRSFFSTKEQHRGGSSGFDSLLARDASGRHSVSIEFDAPLQSSGQSSDSDLHSCS